MLEKIVQIILFQGLFLLIYTLLFRKETFYKLNRFYLIGTSFLSLIIPFIQISLPSESEISTQIIALNEVVLSPQNLIFTELFLANTHAKSGFSVVLWIYLIGVLVTVSLFIWKLTKIRSLIHSNKQQNKRGFVLVALKDSTNVFSFLNYVFIGDKIIEKNPAYLLAHEKVHVTQKHSLDLLWFELLKIVLWFNPFVYLYQKQITALHEFIADAESIKTSDTKTYYNHLLNDLFQVENMAFINQFYNKSLIQKRIIMMSKTQSKQWKQVKYLVLLPVIASMLFMITNVVAQEEVSIYTQTDIVISQDTVPEKKEAIKQLMEFIKKNDSPNKEFMSKNEYIEFQKLASKALPDSLFNKINNRTYEDYLKDKTSPKGMGNAVPFSTIDEAPIYPGCESITDKAEQRECLSKNIQEHVSKNFNVAIAQNLGLTPGKKRIFTMFKIDKEGNITSVRSHAPHKDLELEAVRVIQTLPKMIPGKQDGKAVSVKYSLPISFIVEDKVKEKK